MHAAKAFLSSKIRSDMWYALQVLFDTAPKSYTASCTPVTDVEVGQSVIPPGTGISTSIVPPPQVTLTTESQHLCGCSAPACMSGHAAKALTHQSVSSGGGTGFEQNLSSLRAQTPLHYSFTAGRGCPWG